MDKDFFNKVRRAVDDRGCNDWQEYLERHERGLYEEWQRAVREHQVQHNVDWDSLEYTELEWGKCIIRQMLTTRHGIFRDRFWDTYRDTLPVSWDGRLVHPTGHYIINANPKASNPPCKVQLRGMEVHGITAKAAPGRDTRHNDPGWQGRDRSQWFGSELRWPLQTSPVPRLVQHNRLGHDKDGNKCLLCLVTGHSYRQCRWYWAWLITLDAEDPETSDAMPDGTRELVKQECEIITAGYDNDIELGQIIQHGILILKGQDTKECFTRIKQAQDRKDFAETLGYPPNWQSMTMEQLREIQHTRELGRQAPPKGRPANAPGQQATTLPPTTKAPAATPATGTHSADNYQANRALFDHQQQQHETEEKPDYDADEPGEVKRELGNE